MRRRHFLQTAALAAAATLLPRSLTAAHHGPSPKTLPFTLDLNPGIIGVEAKQKELLQMAIRHGYESITPFSGELSAFSDTELSEFQSERNKNHIGWGSTNLPLEFRQSEAVFQEGLAELPRHAAAMQRAGATRMNTWIMPTHPELHYTANLRQHANRLHRCGEILADYGVQLGLEYVGPKTLMARDRFAFIRTLVELQALLAEINQPNVGYVLDSFHWHCAEDTAEQILALDPAMIATVDINDAQAGLSRDEQIDGARELPLATGVIDLKSFLQALVDISYTGPVRAEPFNKTLNDMDNETALKTNYAAMSAAFDLVR